MRIITNLILSAVIVAGIIACEPQMEIESISLEVSKTSIADDGVEAAVFTVKTNTGVDVTADALIINIDENTVVRGGKFSSDVSGIYVFSASYNGIKSTEVSVKVGSGFADGDGETVWVTTEVITPVRYAEMRHYGSSTSTAIDVTRAESGPNGSILQFTCIPGDKVKSYRVQVFPLSWLYNQLLEYMKDEGKESLTTADANDILRTYITMTDYETLAGQVMNKENLGSNWYSNDFDWLNTSFTKAWGIQPDTDYLIVTLSSFEETCTIEESYAHLAVCHFKTPKVATDGNPELEITYDAGFSSYKATFTAKTDDCKYMYYFCHSKESIDEYIDAYGETMFRDFIRQTEPVSLDVPFEVTTGASDILAMENSAVGVALDQYGVPADTITRINFSLLEKPDDRDLGDATISDIKAASFIARFKINMDKNTRAVYQGIYTKEVAQQYMSADLGTKQNLVNTLFTEGWGHSNRNYRFNKTDGVLAESAAYTDDQAHWNELTPDTEYAILYITCNGYGDLSRLKMSEPFKTAPQVRDLSSTATYDPDFKFTLSAAGVNGLTCKFDFDPDVVAQVFFGMYDPEREFGGIASGFTYPNAKSDRATWMYWLLDYREPTYGYPWADIWTTADSPSGSMDVTIYDLEPGSHYKYACVYETWDGYISDVAFSEVTLQNISWGPNPQITMTVTEEKTQYMGDVYKFDIIGNDNVGEIKYLGAAKGDENSSSLGLTELLAKSSDYSESDYLKMALARTTALGIVSPGNHTYNRIEKRTVEASELYVMIAYGRGKDGSENVYSPVAYYVWTPESGKFQTLSEYLN